MPGFFLQAAIKTHLQASTAYVYSDKSKNEVIRMHMRPSSLFLTVAIGAALMFSPNLIGGNGLMSYDQAFAEQGGNEKGKSSTSNGGAGSAANSHGQTASNLGALNAGHAAPQAFANAAQNSRVGKIKAYYSANQYAAALQSALANALTSNSVTLAQLTAVQPAYVALQANPSDLTLQADYNQALTTAGLTDAQVVALQPAYTASLAADAEAAATLEAAANKTPVSGETKTALDDLIADSIY
jgi:hypothetical protein